MNIISVIPITKLRLSGTLSYFTSSEMPLGSIVSVPIRSKSVSAIVIDSKPATEAKTDIKNADFQIRKLGKIKSVNFFPPGWIKSCSEIANYYATGTGQIISSLVSKSILENLDRLKAALETNLLVAGKKETFAIQGDDEDRMSSWRSLIRQEFARKRSVAIYVPTIEEAHRIKSSLLKGIEDYIFMLNGNLAQKAIVETWNKIAEEPHPVVIIATGSFSVLPRNDIDTVIIERENARGWMTIAAPHIDLREVLEKISLARSQTVYLADTILRTETLYRLQEHEITEGSPFKWKTVSTAQSKLVEMGSAKTDSEEKKQFRVLSPELEDIITRGRDENTHIFLMATRSGLSPITVCNDCETIVSCHECGSPVVLHSSKVGGRNFFMCHHCGARRAADEVCIKCGGWRLSQLGIGTDRIADEIKKLFPGYNPIIIDAEKTKTEKQIETATNAWRSQPGGILVGTETALLHIKESVEHIAVVSLDSLLALPDFRSQERMMYILTRLRALATRTFTVQTRRPEEKVFEYALKSNSADFFRQTKDERKQFMYPPFSVLIKISIEGKKEPISKEMAVIRDLVAPHEIQIFPAFTAVGKGNSAIHGLIKIKKESWPDQELIEKLRVLPAHITVKINPESLL